MYFLLILILWMQPLSTTEQNESNNLFSIRFGIFLDLMHGHGYEPLSFGNEIEINFSNFTSNFGIAKREKKLYGEQYIYYTDLSFKYDFIWVGYKYHFADFNDVNTHRYVSSYIVGLSKDSWKIGFQLPDSSNYKTRRLLFEKNIENFKINILASQADFKSSDIYSISIGCTFWIF